MIFGKKRKPLMQFGPANVWFCEECRSHGPTEFDEGETVYSAVERIREAHKLKSPDCTGGTAYIRLVNLETLKAKGLVA